MSKGKRSKAVEKVSEVTGLTDTQAQEIINGLEMHTSNELSPIAGKGKADKTATDKAIREAKQILGTVYDKLPVYDTDGNKVAGKVISWRDIFAASMVSETNRDKAKAAKDAYALETGNVQALLMCLVKKASTLEKFDAAYNAMKLVWKSEEKEVGQALYNAASIVRRGFRAKLHPEKLPSIHAIKKQLSEQKKADEKQAIKAPNELAELFHQFTAVHAELNPAESTQLIAELTSLGKKFAAMIATVTEQPEVNQEVTAVA